MKVDKTFKLLEDREEEAFLNEYAKEGYLLSEYDGKTYSFSKVSKTYYYLVEYFDEKLNSVEIIDYQIKGYELIYILDLTKDGFYYYFVSENEVVDSDRNLEDRYNLLSKRVNHIDRFSVIIFSSNVLLFLYLLIKTRESKYLIILVLMFILGIYFYNIYNVARKKLNEYKSIIESR